MNFAKLLYILAFGCIIIFPSKSITKNKYSVTIVQNNYIDAPEIECVSVDEKNYNTIIVKNQSNRNIQFYNIYRSSNANSNEWKLVTRTTADSIELIKDLSLNAQFQSYYYKVSAVDRCGNEYFSNGEYRTIQLKVKFDIDNANKLQWNFYKGAEIERYYICRGVDSKNLEIIDSVSSSINNYIDIDKKEGDECYQIVAKGKVKLKKNKDKNSEDEKEYSDILSYSNIVMNRFDSVLNTFTNDNLLIIPNPLISSSTIKFPLNNRNEYELKIYDISGNLKYEEKLSSNEFILHKGLWQEGIYVLQISDNKNSIQKKLQIGNAQNVAK